LKAMQTRDFSFTYAGAGKPSLEKVNMPVYEKKVTAVIGPSGCGKSTLLRSLNRIHDLYPGCRYEGEILLKSAQGMQNILELKGEEELIALRRKVGMIFQKPVPFPMSVYDNVAYALRLAGVTDKSVLDEKVEAALKSAALWSEVKERLKEDAKSLSGGQQQRLCIARAVAVEPEVLLMDEPTSALDPVSTAAIEELVRRLKKKLTIVIVTHNLAQARRLSDYTAHMYNGRLVEFGDTERVFTSPKEKLTRDYIAGKFG